ncbi:hypothetical protein F5984_19100 [Rudanella paleaurantiibacter]|uniref:DUF6268 domain-containing protein n=1 Tax=Rudanella paleaurantiibacter TaxID=2614655 RepID=A0A7J5TUQ9_9BACT|nr:DUF6268 family outer membrane beta-barrel protein [Rudanella paleaurantiibacter]KAB7727879.1 hypothetical protein F5984_19100 [Rudanella paleaurantiibacter]
MYSRFIKLLVLACLTYNTATAQTTPADTTSAPPEDLNFDEFSDADDRKVKTFATQKVLYMSPTRLISVGYEAQFGPQLTSVGSPEGGQSITDARLTAYRGLRLAYNTPVISRSNFILNLGVSYWNTGIQTDLSAPTGLKGALEQGLRTAGVNATVFKPLNNTHFLIIQANADANGNYRALSDLSSKHLTYSGTAIFGWKKDDNFMWGLGLTRTYRGGDLLHIPVLFYNRTFSPKWGVEAILPARAAIRRNFGTNALLSFGYELEGNSFFLSNNAGRTADWFVRRSEIKPRLNYERKLKGFVWLAVQGGMAINWRYDVLGTQNPVANEKPLFANTLRNAPYVNVSLNLVSP